MLKKISAGITIGILLILMLSTSVFAGNVLLTLSAENGEAGNSVIISGTYDPNEWVSIKITDQKGNLIFFKSIKTQDNGTYNTTFIVPDINAETLKVTAGNGSDTQNAAFTVTQKTNPSSPSSDTGTDTTVSDPSKEPTQEMTDEPSVNMQTSGQKIYIIPISIKENREAETVTIIISSADLPEGTTSIMLPDTMIIDTKNKETIKFTLNTSFISKDKLITITALDEEDLTITDCYVRVNLPDVSEPSEIPDTSDPQTEENNSTILLWILGAVILAGGITVAILIKRKNT